MTPFDADKQPLVSIIIPMLNEVDAIDRCIDSILHQTYPSDRLEIRVVDGLSGDGSRERVQELARRHPNIFLHDNPQKCTPRSLNIGVLNAQGEIVIILGAHTRIHPDFIKLNVHYMREMQVACSGGTQINTGDTWLQRAIGMAMGSRFGIPSAPYRFYKKNCFVDTVVYAAYRRELFDQVGLFDEELHISEDAELNWRIRKAGFKIFYTPEIISYYYPRRNLNRLWKQFFNYGILRINVMKKHPDAVKPMHLIPPVFVLALMGLFVSGWFYRPLFSVLGGIALVYLLYTLVASLITGVQNKKWTSILILPAVFMTMQLAWGLGFLKGIYKTYK